MFSAMGVCSSITSLTVTEQGCPISFCAILYWQSDRESFYPNVTTLRSGLSYRNSVCRLSSVVCLSSVTLVHPAQAVEAFGNTSSPLCTLIAHPLTCVQNFTEIVPGEALHRMR